MHSHGICQLTAEYPNDDPYDCCTVRLLEQKKEDLLGVEEAEDRPGSHEALVAGRLPTDFMCPARRRYQHNFFIVLVHMARQDTKPARIACNPLQNIFLAQYALDILTLNLSEQVNRSLQHQQSNPTRQGSCH